MGPGGPLGDPCASRIVVAVHVRRGGDAGVTQLAAHHVQPCQLADMILRAAVVGRHRNSGSRLLSGVRTPWPRRIRPAAPVRGVGEARGPGPASALCPLIRGHGQRGRRRLRGGEGADADGAVSASWTTSSRTHSRIARSGASRTRRVSPGFLPPRRTRQSPHPGYLDRRHLPARPATPAWLRRSRAQEVDTLADANHERTP